MGDFLDHGALARLEIFPRQPGCDLPASKRDLTIGQVPFFTVIFSWMICGMIPLCQFFDLPARKIRKFVMNVLGIFR